MPHLFAQKKSRIRAFWAMSFVLVLSSCNSCKTEKNADLSILKDDVSSLPADYLLGKPPKKPGDAACSVKKRKSNSPNLSAHFIEQSLSDDMCFEDVINILKKGGELHCAPGPFLIEDGSIVDVEKNEWELAKTPDFFAWNLENKGFVDENFYITNQHGLPIKSQAIRLQNDNDATVVLLPKTDLLPGVKYYIYLVVNTKDSKRTWIQPITTTVQNKNH